MIETALSSSSCRTSDAIRSISRAFGFRGGIDFTFPSGPDLPPGGFVVVVENAAAFVERYGTDGIRGAGQYRGKLGNSSDELILEGALGEPIHAFAYADAWYPSTDGAGKSLVVVDANADLGAWSTQAGWKASAVDLGTPGFPDAPPNGSVPSDSNRDGTVDISDALSLLQILFLGGQDLPCDGDVGSDGNRGILDANGDAGVNVTDAIYLLAGLFQGGPPPSLGWECVEIVGCEGQCSP